MNKLITLQLEMSFGGVKETFYPVVLCDEETCILVDCGYVGSLSYIEEALSHQQLSPEMITHLIITHQDHDHLGAAAALKEKYPQVRVLASMEEAPFISGARKSLRLEQAEQLQKVLPEEKQAFGKAFCDLLRRVEPVQVDQLLKGDECLPFCGGCQVLATPGHTPGHISLYLSEFDTILSGDAMALQDGRPVMANPQFTLDTEQAKASMHLLLDHPARTIICYHGGLFKK